MENASKALLIAAAVLVAIIIITLGIRIYTSSSGTEKVATDTGKTISEKTEDATDLAVSEITRKTHLKAIDFYGKTVKTVQPGDDIKIGNEKFQIKSKTNTKIIALAYYNIELKLDKPKQSASAGTISFCTDPYWPESTKYGDDLNMTEKNDDGIYKNNIQQYIDAYQNTIGLTGITTRAPRKADVYSTPGLRNPSKIGEFWLGSRGEYFTYVGYVCNDGGGMSSTNCGRVNTCGVRPIIEIDI